jgi:Flp pilus assembly protein TadG
MSRARSERGAAAVELALIAPVLVLLLFGIAEFGRAYGVQTTLAGAAREGVRAMALENSPSAARSAARAAAPGLGLRDGQIAVSPTTCPTAAGAPSTTATVTITYPLSFISGMFGTTITLHGTGVMRCNG